MQPITQQLEEIATNINRLLDDLYHNHAKIYLWNKPGSVVVVAGGDYAFRKLDDTGRQIQSRLHEEYTRFYALLSALLNGQPKDTLRELKELHKKVMDRIELNRTYEQTEKAAVEKGKQALLGEIKLLKRLYDPSEGTVIFVPDTNAILSNTDLEKWSFAEAKTFILLLLPTVLSELDGLKVNHRNETVREKAKTLINKFKEYRRRGRLSDGVVLVKDVSTIRSLAIEPDFTNSLPWLSPDNNDDRFLCAVVEVMRAHARSLVLIVTADINLQNKAEFAQLPFVEPPEPI